MEYEAAAQATESSTEVKAKKKSWFDKLLYYNRRVK